ncbi:MAG: Rad52/Rad22 family DNA repair protein [Candidatus Cloacimonetes bacterium]|nr:Rad52/Rad22 family DNA repair protein [Candidatus Cloacimonadota bacterium]
MENKPSPIQEALKAPFSRSDIEFRVGRVSAKNHKANVLAYITARGIMNRLDNVFGIEGWKDEYELLASGVKCRLSVKLGKDWVTKEDVAPFTNIEALKGAFSDSLKRAGVKFGIGRYLYDLPEHWVDIQPERPRDATLPIHYISSDSVTGWWEEPQLPDWALPDVKIDLPQELMALLDELKAANLVTKTKHGYYINALSRPGLTETQKALIGEQLALIRVWGEKVVHNPDIPVEMQKGSYRSIINSGVDNIEKVRDDLLNLAEIGHGEAVA